LCLKAFDPGEGEMAKNRRVLFEDGQDGPVIRIRARRSSETIFFIFFLIVVFPVMQTFLLSQVFLATTSFWTLLFALVLFPASGLIIGYSLIWQHSGQEIITVTPSGLRIRKKIYGPGNEYFLENVDVHSIEPSSSHILRRGSYLMFWGLPWQRAIQLRSNGHRRLIGSDLGPDEAEEVIRFLRHHLSTIGTYSPAS